MASEIFHEDLVAAIGVYRIIHPSEGLTRSSQALMFASLETSAVPAEPLIEQDPEAEPRWSPADSVPVGSVEDEVIGFVRDADAVKPGGAIRIFEGETDPDFWNHPLVLEACLRVTKPAEALIDHYNRGTRMLTELGRPEDAKYDYMICERLVDYRLAITPEFLAGLEEKQREDLKGLVGNVFNNFGYVLMQTGQIEAAMPRLQKALAYNPRQVYANNNLGDCYRRLGRTDLARGYYAQELAVNPAHPTAQTSLASL